MTRYYIGLGSNMGDRLEHLVGAVHEIGELAESWSVSSVYETDPVGGPEQAPFLNAVVAVDTSLTPLELLLALQQIEARHERERTVRWGPRTLDLDIVAWEGRPHVEEQLVIPHPRAKERAFVLKPLMEIGPEVEVGDGLTVSEALSTVDRDGVDRLAGDWMPPRSRVLPYALVAGQFVIFAAVAAGVIVSGSLPDEAGLSVILGGVALVGGALIALWASWLLGPGMTASPVPSSRATQLVDSGPYRWVRHPIYTGVCLIMLGTAGLFASWPATVAALALVPYLLAKSSYEERQLRLRFSDYKAYQRRVPWRLLPYVT